MRGWQRENRKWLATYMRGWRQDNPDKVRARQARHRDKHRDRIRDYARRWHAKGRGGWLRRLIQKLRGLRPCAICGRWFIARNGATYCGEPCQRAGAVERSREHRARKRAGAAR